MLLCVAVLIGLGLWQLDRLQWKEDMLARISAGIALPAQDFATVYNTSSNQPDFRHVSLDGAVISQKPLFVYGRTRDGVAGVHVLCLVEATGGLHVLLDRGFVSLPVDEKKADAPVTFPVDGVVRVAQPKARFEPQNDAAKNQWFWMDVTDMTRALRPDDHAGSAKSLDDVIDLQGLAGVYVEALKPTAPDGPVPTADHLLENIPNNHLQYAITWFSLASVLIVMYGVWVVRQVNGRQA